MDHTQNISKDAILDAIRVSQNMTEASRRLGLSYQNFRHHAKKHGVFKTNQGRIKGSKHKYELEDILNGKHPNYHSYKLKLRLYEAGLKENKCECCGISSWSGFQIQCELDHIDGDKQNNRLENLRILCPNCHSQTDTFRAKNMSKVKLH